MPINTYTPDIKMVVIRMVMRGMRFHDIVTTLGVDVSLTSVRRWFDLYQTTRAVITNPDDHMIPGPRPILGQAQRDFILEALHHDPTLFLDELQQKITERFGMVVCLKTLSNEVRLRIGWTRKKARTVHPNQSDEARGAYIGEVFGIDPYCLVFTDETAVNKRHLYREFARAPRGERTVRLERPTRSQRWSVLPAISLGGLVALAIQPGGYSRIDFEAYLENQLLPAMNPWPARNSVLVMDNAPIHHGGNINALCEARGIRLLYLPAYSPDFNPIELGFSPLKSRLKRSRALHRAIDVEGEEASIFVTCLNLFTDSLCLKLFMSCRYL